MGSDSELEPEAENILVCQLDYRDDFVKVLDFGLAKLRDIAPRECYPK